MSEVEQLRAENAALLVIIAELRAEIAELRTKLGQNSSKPPSTDSPFKRPRPSPPTGSKAGA